MHLCLKYSMAVWIVAIATIQQPAVKSPDSADTAELTRLETVWNEAHVHGDADALDRLWSDDLVVTMTDMSLMTKQQAIGIWRSGHMKFLRYQTTDIRIRVYGDAAVVTGPAERTRSVNGKDVDDKWRFTKLYIRSAREWRVVAYHASTAVK